MKFPKGRCIHSSGAHITNKPGRFGVRHLHKDVSTGTGLGQLRTPNPNPTEPRSLVVKTDR